MILFDRMDANSNSRIEKPELAKFLGCDESSDEVKDALQRMGDECSDGCVSFDFRGVEQIHEHLEAGH